MPQLMPLSWEFSWMMIMMVVLGACLVYSISVMNEEIKSQVKVNNMKMKTIWCW